MPKRILHSRLRPMTLLLVCALCTGVYAPASADPPGSETGTSWNSFRHDPNHTGVASCTLTNDLELLWESTLGDQLLGTPAIVGDEIYVSCLSGEVVCLDKTTGRRKWAYRTMEVVPKNSFAPGFKSSPTVTGDSIYLGDEEGVFHAIHRRTGKGKWKFNTGGEIFSGGAVIGGRVIFGSYDGRLYCLNERDGSLAWRYETKGRIHSTPVIVDQMALVTGCDQSLHGVDIQTGKSVFELPLNDTFIATPSVIDDTLYVGTYSGYVIAVDFRKKETLWRYAESEGHPFQSSTSVTDNLVVLGGHDRQIHAINRLTGGKKWIFPTRSKVDSSPAVVDSRVFIGSADGNLYGLSLADGKEVWKYNIGKPISAGPAIGEGVLVVSSASRDGRLYCFGKK